MKVMGMIVAVLPAMKFANTIPISLGDRIFMLHVIRYFIVGDVVPIFSHSHRVSGFLLF